MWLLCSEIPTGDSLQQAVDPSDHRRKLDCHYDDKLIVVIGSAAQGLDIEWRRPTAG
jgi:hypothetical protein